jgi:hypothetical protein
MKREASVFFVIFLMLSCSSNSSISECRQLTIRESNSSIDTSSIEVLISYPNSPEESSKSEALEICECRTSKDTLYILAHRNSLWTRDVLIVQVVGSKARTWLEMTNDIESLIIPFPTCELSELPNRGGIELNITSGKDTTLFDRNLRFAVSGTLDCSVSNATPEWLKLNLTAPSGIWKFK